jgi:hypothetical protein
VLARLPAWQNVALEQLARGPETHTLAPLPLQRRAHEVVDGALERALAGVPAPAVR